MRRGAVESIAVLVSLVALAGDLQAQRPQGLGGALGLSFVAADAVGDLGLLVNKGFGVDLTAAGPVAANGHVRVRGNLGMIVYGHERLQYCNFSCRVGSDLTTTNSIAYLGVGPEVVLATGGVQPYVHSTVGMSYFFTSSALDDNDGYGSYSQTTNYSDLVFAWKFGGGVRFKLGGDGAHPVYLDFGVERHINGVANYLTEGDIVDNSDGSVTLYPNRSEANLVGFRLGFAVGLGGG